jgi:hypothetical protein
MSLYNKRDKPAKKWTPPPRGSEKAENLARAQRENFALYLLMGRSTHFFKGVVPAYFIKEIEKAQLDAIKYIKAVQWNRKIKANAKRKK